MTTRTLLLLALLAPIPMTTLFAQTTLSSLVDRSRVLLIFAPNAKDTRYTTQLAAFEHHESGLRTRDLVIIPVLQDPGPPNTSDTLRQLQPPPIPDGEQIALRKRFQIAPNEFSVILVGKDGGEKLRSSTPLTVLQLFRTIDAMPGRKAEMQTSAEVESITEQFG